jgi:hypothetical protein
LPSRCLRVCGLDLGSFCQIERSPRHFLTFRDTFYEAGTKTRLWAWGLPEVRLVRWVRFAESRKSGAFRGKTGHFGAPFSGRCDSLRSFVTAVRIELEAVSERGCQRTRRRTKSVHAEGDAPPIALRAGRMLVLHKMVFTVASGSPLARPVLLLGRGGHERRRKEWRGEGPAVGTSECPKTESHPYSRAGASLRGLVFVNSSIFASPASWIARSRPRIRMSIDSGL